MNELLFIIIGSASVGYSFAELSGVPQGLSQWLYDKFNIGKKVNGFEYIKTPLRLKPFDCGYCLSFWTGFLTTFYFDYADLILSVMVGFTASVIASLLKKYL
jgi:hypothetical protein